MLTNRFQTASRCGSRARTCVPKRSGSPNLPCAGRYLAFAHLLAQDSASRLEASRQLADELTVPLVAVGDVH
jgi:hypothetical protein